MSDLDLDDSDVVVFNFHDVEKVEMLDDGQRCKKVCSLCTKLYSNSNTKRLQTLESAAAYSTCHTSYTPCPATQMMHTVRNRERCLVILYPNTYD